MLRELTSLPLLLAIALGFSLLAVPAVGQGVSQGTPQSQVESAARARVPRAPNSAWGSNEGQVSTQPRVLFEDGQLTINASDSSLSDVLYALRASTGADIDIPPGANSERVTAQLGPGPARKVLSDLLSWSSFDYVIQASDSDPLSIHSVTLMVRIKSAPSTAPGTPGRAAAVAARPVDPAPVSAPAETPEPENHSEAPAANANSNSNTNGPDSLNPQSQPAQAKGADMTPAGSGSGKSPADMIQELQQMYQQRRSIQEQQNRAAGGMPPQSSSQ